jgi:hypothetical protein
MIQLFCCLLLLGSTMVHSMEQVKQTVVASESKEQSTQGASFSSQETEVIETPSSSQTTVQPNVQEENDPFVESEDGGRCVVS